MRSKRLILGFALFALAVGYIELRLPPPVAAQGTDAVFQRLAVSSDARVSGTATVGVLEFETALTPAVTALLAASGTASAATFLRGDGAWQGVSPPTYWDIETAAIETSSLNAWADTGLGFSVVTTATDTVLLNVWIGTLKDCEVRISGGSTALLGHVIRVRQGGPTGELSVVLVDTPGTGTNIYKVQVSRWANNVNCNFLKVTDPGTDAATFLAQVLR